MSNINQDIQASHKILAMQEEANEHSDRIVDMLPGIFIVLNERYEILRSNIEFAKTFNIKPENVLRMQFSSIFKRESWEVFARNLKSLENDPTKENIKFELSLDDSGIIPTQHPFYWQLSRMNRGNGAEGNLYTIVGEDITQLRESEKKLLNVFASIPLGILTVNEDGMIEDTYSNYLGYLLNSDDFKEKKFREVLFDPIYEDLSAEEKKGVENLAACLNGSEALFQSQMDTFPKVIYFGNSTKDKKGKFLQISYKPVCYEGVVKRLLVIIEDRTDIIKAEEDQKNANLLEKQSRAVYESAIRDPLTGLYTRLYMQNEVNGLLEAHDNNKFKDASLIMFDVDHFKKFNDTYGHDVGDQVLAAIGSVVLKQSRDGDIPVRFGGEELMVFLKSNCHSARLLAERVRSEVEKLEIKVGDKIVRVTISGGIASHSSGEDIAQLIKRADLKLYQAKDEGRNRIISES